MRRGLAVVLAAGLALAACTRGEPRTLTPPSVTADGRQPVVVVDGATIDGGRAGGASAEPRVFLAEGAATPIAAGVRVVTGEPLDDASFAAVLDRLPAWDVPADDVSDFERPTDRLAPPVAGTQIESQFPPPGQPVVEQPATGPLHVLRYQPEGEVLVAPFVSVTFDQPMAPLATLDQLAGADVPVTITPAVEGRWRWIGTRTVRFEVVPGATSVADRLPAATEYTVEVPAGTTSETGGVLAETVRFTFATPAPTVQSLTGVGDSMPLDPVFVAVFDQIVDPAAVLASITVTVAGQRVELRPATRAEVAADPAAAGTVANALDRRWVAFTPVAALPTDSPVTVTIGPGTPSAEGPRASTEAFTRTGYTYGPFEVGAHFCGWRPDDECQPGWPLTVEFTNPIQTDGLTRARVAELVDVQPAIPGMAVNVSGSTIQVSGATAGRTTYQVTVSPEWVDVFGQALGEPQVLEYRVGEARPELQGFPRDFVTLDPLAATPAVAVATTNHDSVRVEAWAVTPADRLAFRDFLSASYDDPFRRPDWPEVLDAEIAIDGADDQPTETLIDLRAAFAAAGGSQLVVRVSPTRTFDRDSSDYWSNRPTIAWVQHTTLGLDAFLAVDKLVLWTTDLRTGEPVGGVSVEVFGPRQTVTTDAGGLATIELGNGDINGLHATAPDGRDALLLPRWEGAWSAERRSDETRWYVFDDRGIYRPGETVRLAGWLRHVAWSDDAALGLPRGDGLTVDYTVHDAWNNEIATGSAAVNALGGFDVTFEVDPAANLGDAQVRLALSPRPDATDADYYHSFRIDEFRRPEYEVTARAESPAPHYAAAALTVSATANYYSGGPLPGAQVDWLVSTAAAHYSPPGWDDYRFGEYTPWWWGGHSGGVVYDVGCWDCWPTTPTTYETFTGRTNADGTHYLRVALGAAGDDPDAPAIDLPRTVTASATVYDVNRQAWADDVSLLVHPAAYYVGLRSDRAFVQRGTPIRIDTVVADVDGRVAAGRAVTVTAGRVEWTSFGDESDELLDLQTCTLTSGAEPGRCEFATEVGGQYRVTAVVADGSGHASRSEMTVWVAGGTAHPSRRVEQESVTVVPAADTCAPGDTAELLVQAPFAPASGVYTVLHAGIRESHAFHAPDGSATLRIPVRGADVPELTVHVEMTGAAPRLDDDGTPAGGAPARPAYATGQIVLPVTLAERTLTVTATPADTELEPGATTSVTVAVADARGRPVAGAGVALVVVDEAVLALTDFQLSDPLSVFYTSLGDGVEATYSRGAIVLTQADLAGVDEQSGDDAGASDGETTAPAAPEMGTGGADYDTAAGTPIGVRANFDALALFEPALTTGADGTVVAGFDLPDSLTRYRVMAVAVDGATHFGRGEAAITARLPLMARPSAPRFANFGDRFELPVVLHNQTGQELSVDVGVEVANLELTGPIGRRVAVPANDRVEVRFPVATVSAGTARYRVAVVSTDAALGLADAVAGELPVYTPATAEAFATYGVVDAGGTPNAVSQTVLSPTGVFAQFGGLEMTTSSTALQALTDAVLYLHEYHYTSTDAHASRLLAIASLRDVLGAFGAAGLPPAAELDAVVTTDIDAIVGAQFGDGGWAWWRGMPESSPWMTLVATHALVVADREGYPVPSAALEAAFGYLADIERHFDPEWPESIRWTMRAYAVYVLDQAGRTDTAKAEALYREAGDELQLDALAWLWPSIGDAGLRAEIERTFANRVVETAGAASFATDYGESAWVIAASDRRTDGIVLDALIGEQPGSDLIPKVVAGLLAGQTKGRWNNAYDNAFILIALHRYFETYEATTPDFVARVWLGDTYVSEHAFVGRSTDRAHTLVPMEVLLAGLPGGATELVVQNDGTGRLYYRLGLRYAPADLRLAARDEGFVVDRVYEAVDDPADVTRDADGMWHIRAGAKVRVRLTMVADAVRYHVALVDPLPAGLEALNPALAVTQPVLPDDRGDDGPIVPLGRYWWWGPWYEHENLGDDRVEAATSYLSAGTFEYTYVARATTPGTFVVPPARAEEMYSPETFGRSASTTVVIE